MEKNNNTRSISPSNQNNENLQRELQEKSNKIINLEYELDLLKHHNGGFSRNNQGSKIEKLKSELDRKTDTVKDLEYRQKKLE